MDLSLVVNSLEGIDENFQKLYTQDSTGVYRLNVLGLEDTEGLKKNSQKLLDEKKALQEKLKAFEGIDDPEQVRQLLKQQRDIKEKKLIDAGEIDKVISERTDLLRKDYDNRLKASFEENEKTTAENARLRDSLNKAVVERGIIDAVNSVGTPVPSALDDILARGLRVWQVDENGTPVAMANDGTHLYGVNGKDRMTMKEYASSLLQSAPHLFMPSTGGGARGSSHNGTGGLSSEEISKLSPSQKMALGRQGGTKTAS